MAVLAVVAQHKEMARRYCYRNPGAIGGCRWSLGNELRVGLLNWLPGDAVFVYTGWGDRWTDPDTEKVYYSMAPGLSYDAVKWLSEKRVVVVGLDTPFIDPVAEGQLAGKVGPPPGTPLEFPFASHDHLLAQMGILIIENAKLDEIARDRVWTSCTMILPLREKGSAGSPVRPVAIGVPGR